MMTNKEIMDIAMKQSAVDLNADVGDFVRNENVITSYVHLPNAKKYYYDPVVCNLVSYGNNIVASVIDEYRDIVEEYLGKFTFYHCFETPNMHWLDERMSAFGYKVCFMAEYYLPDIDILKRQKCDFRLELLTQKDFKKLYLPQWGNALCEDRKELDVLGVGAFDGDEMVGFAACSADAEEMWQIGVDVLPEYRGQGIAKSLTTNLAAEILDRNKVPFYCSAWSNIRSARNAFRCGFIPAWAEMTVKPKSQIDDMNR